MKAPPGRRICTTCMGLGHTPIPPRELALLVELSRGRAILAHARGTPALHARIEDMLVRDGFQPCGQTATNNALTGLLADGLVDRFFGGGPVPDRWVITPRGRRALATRRARP